MRPRCMHMYTRMPVRGCTRASTAHAHANVRRHARAHAGVHAHAQSHAHEDLNEDRGKALRRHSQAIEIGAPLSPPPAPQAIEIGAPPSPSAAEELRTAQHDAGLALVALRRFEDAGLVFESLVTDDPERRESWAALGVCMSELGQPEAALACQRQVLQIEADRRSDSGSPAPGDSGGGGGGGGTVSG